MMNQMRGIKIENKPQKWLEVVNILKANNKALNKYRGGDIPWIEFGH